jgi:DNA (cytosine-5)-methyltransferase 1
VTKRANKTEAGRKPTVLDLFSGCGGLSLGFHSAGYEVVAGVEIDEVAARTHARNFHGDDARHAVGRSVLAGPESLWKDLGLTGSPHVDVLVGGPPCQAFARVGRAKLRSESKRRGGPGHEGAWLEDPRVGLYRSYLEFVRVLKPSALLMENVPDVLNHGGRNLMEEVCEALEDCGYEARYTLLNAAHHGVPQMRERMFLIAFRRELRAGTPQFPEPTHHHELPRGYGGTRACAVRPLRMQDTSRFVDLPPETAGRWPAITAKQALADLPKLRAIEMLQEGTLRRGARSLDVPDDYPRRDVTGYARLMRQWPGFESDAATGHVIRYLPRDYPIFRDMKAGDQYPEALAIARKRLESELRRHKRLDSNGRKELEAAIVPPYDAGKFPNKWRKMESEAPARTLMAHLGKDSYSHIHYDSKQARTISVREAARLQSFPDGFRIVGSMNAGFRQIGNAVPPLLAYALARQIGGQLGYRLLPDFRPRFFAPRRRPAKA